jgi:hypothetical protein
MSFDIVSIHTLVLHGFLFLATHNLCGENNMYEANGTPKMRKKCRGMKRQLEGRRRRRRGRREGRREGKSYLWLVTYM